MTNEVPQVGETWRLQTRQGYDKTTLVTRVERVGVDPTKLKVFGKWEDDSDDLLMNYFSLEDPWRPRTWTRVDNPVVDPIIETSEPTEELCVMENEVRIPLVGETWQLKDGNLVYTGTVTNVEALGSGEKWRVYANWLHKDDSYQGKERAASLSKSNCANWKLLSEGVYRPKNSAFDEKITKALKDDAWSMLDGRFKKK